jgi:hypothetical protein
MTGVLNPPPGSCEMSERANNIEMYFLLTKYIVSFDVHPVLLSVFL